MICWQLFIAFFKIGLFSFGGGYGMITLIRETGLANGWLTEKELLSFIAVSESTPGPLAVNMATFIGASQKGAAGAFFATVGVVTPSFLVILAVAALLGGMQRSACVQAFFAAVRPCVAALVFATAVTMGMRVLCGMEHVSNPCRPEFDRISVFALVCGIEIGVKKIKHSQVSPVLLILVSAGAGIVSNLLSP